MSALVDDRGSRAFQGLGNLARREAAMWWTTGRWRLQALVWTAILGGLLASMLWLLPAVMAAAPGADPLTGDAREVALQFPDMAAAVTAVGVVLLVQGAILDERRNGVLEWLLSKPLTRRALVVAKFLGQTAGLLVTLVAIPWVAVYLLLGAADGQLWSAGRVVAVGGVMALVVGFHLALVLALSTLTTSRVVILAVPLAAIVGADAITGLWPDAFYVSPWSLGSIASLLLADGVLVSVWPIVATVAWTVALLVVAATSLERSEL
jgi:ABC-2 type transport system permease protein